VKPRTPREVEERAPIELSPPPRPLPNSHA
jgi:hypothetical protein